MSTSAPEAKLEALGIDLDSTRTEPAGQYVNVAQSGTFVFVSGHGPLVRRRPAVVGKVPSAVTTEEARNAARIAALNCLSSLRDHMGDLGRVSRLLHVLGMVNADSGFTDLAYVIDGASELFVTVFGDVGIHTRTSVGMNSLPFGIAVEIELIVTTDAGVGER